MKHYWFIPNKSHDCKKLQCRELSEFDIVSMQTIDASCNDCKWFKREKLIKTAESNIYAESMISRAKALQSIAKKGSEMYLEAEKDIQKAKEIKPEIIKLGKSGTYWRGQCTNPNAASFNTEISAFPVHYMGMPCFEHRKANVLTTPPETN